MPRSARVARGGMVFHVLNRGVGRMRLFSKEQDFAAFENLLDETWKPHDVRICAYCLMPNHWHLVLWPKRDGALAAFMQQLTTKHVRRWQLHRKRVGYGHVYQGRYKSFPVEEDQYFYQLVRYVERNALRAGLVPRAENWRWCSLWRRVAGTTEQQKILSGWPLPIPQAWRKLVNEPQTEAELRAIRGCVRRGRPYGDGDWVNRTARRLGLESTLRPPHRPKKKATTS
jgi:putative transposase